MVVLSLAAWLNGSRAWAVVDANSRSNTNAPADGAPWSNVGQQLAGASATYLGAGWALTANHAGTSGVRLNGTIYEPDGTMFRLTNSTGTSTDLLLFRLTTMPPLPRLPLATAAPVAGSTVDFISGGFISGSAQTNFGGGLIGYYWSSNEFKSWGNNKVLGGTTVVDAGEGPVTVFTTQFDSSGQTSDEAQAVNGDSGGGVFQKNGSTWQLVGVILYQGLLLGQQTNTPPNTSVFGDQNDLANIATYAGQISAYLTNTRPTLSIAHSNTNVLVCWADTGATWTLLSNHNLATTNWTVLTPTLTLTNGQYCALLPPTNSPTFYRLKK